VAVHDGATGEELRTSVERTRSERLRHATQPPGTVSGSVEALGFDSTFATAGQGHGDERRIRKQAILAYWIRRHGPLSDASRARFLARREVGPTQQYDDEL